MRILRTLDALLPKTRQGILATTLVQPEKAWYVSELARRMGVPASSLQRELHDLAAVGILKTHRQGRMVYYQANTDSPVFADLRGLLFKTAGFVDVLAHALRPLAARLRTAQVMAAPSSTPSLSEARSRSAEATGASRNTESSAKTKRTPRRGQSLSFHPSQGR